LPLIDPVRPRTLTVAAEPGCPVVFATVTPTASPRSAAEILGAFFLFSSSPAIVTALPANLFLSKVP